MADFYKYHALGNDYIVIDPADGPFDPSAENVRTLCSRNTGIGSDGILLGPSLQNNLHLMRVFNPDGGEAEKSGNGVRIFAKYLRERGYVKNDKFTVATKGGNVGIELLEHNMIRADMGTVTFKSAEIPMLGPERDVVGEILLLEGKSYPVTCLSIGIPHCVVISESISPELAQKVGPMIEKHRLFPNRTNVQFVKVKNRNSIEIEIWERGAGYTLASGSSACASACVTHKLAMTGNKIEVRMQGGSVNVEIKDDGHVFLTGPVLGVMQGNFSGDLKKLLK